jgi:ABC-type nickel/cobalt efflux system permease component RcnA
VFRIGRFASATGQRWKYRVWLATTVAALAVSVAFFSLWRSEPLRRQQARLPQQLDNHAGQKANEQIAPHERIAHTARQQPGPRDHGRWPVPPQERLECHVGGPDGGADQQTARNERHQHGERHQRRTKQAGDDVQRAEHRRQMECARRIAAAGEQVPAGEHNSTDDEQQQCDGGRNKMFTGGGPPAQG